MERFTISLDDRLASQFDTWLAERQYANRSEAVRDLLRGVLGRSRLEEAPAGQCVACLSYVYNHHERELAERLTALQHDHHEMTVSTMHVHLDHEHCLETVVLRGATDRVVAFSDRTCAERGVHHGKLNLISVELHHPHGEGGQEGHRHGEPMPEPAAGAASVGVPHLHVKPAA